MQKYQYPGPKKKYMCKYIINILKYKIAKLTMCKTKS
jgi:hypothetical protein